MMELLIMCVQNFGQLLWMLLIGAFFVLVCGLVGMTDEARRR